MKRVQAIVTGKKKQCTKLPTPSTGQQKDKKGKPVSTGSTPSSATASSATSSTTAAAGPEESVVTKTTASFKAKSAKTSGAKVSKDSGKSGSVSVSRNASNASSVVSTVSSNSNHSNSNNNNNNNNNNDNSGDSVEKSTGAPGNKGKMSKIPASSPKKGSKDASSKSPGKPRLRLDAEGKSKIRHVSEPASRKKSLKETSTGDGKETVSSPGPAGAAAATVDLRKSSDEHRSARRDLFNEGNRKTVVIDGWAHSMDDNNKPSSEAGDEGVQKKDKDRPEKEHQSSTNGAIRKLSQSSDASLRGQDGQGSYHPPHSASTSVSYPHVVTSNGHGHKYSEAGNHPVQYGPVDGRGTIVENPYARVSRAPSRGGSVRSSNEQMYTPGYGSLPRSSSSRSTTPTNDIGFSYGSLPRGSKASTPTQPGMTYFGSNTTQGWASLGRRAESDSGFHVPNMDRARHPDDMHAVMAYNNPIYHRGHPGGHYNHQSRVPANGHHHNYAVVNQNYQPPRPGSVPPPENSDASSESVYGPVVRPGSVPPHHFYHSDSDGGGSGSYSRGVNRAGSVPLGYESESSAYHGHLGGAPRNYESDSGYGTRRSGLKVRPEDERYRAAPGRRPIPRRHTVGAPHNKQVQQSSETERKREAFMQLLAQRYPQYADKIQGKPATSAPEPGQDRPARSRDGQRRRTAVVTYDPSQAGNTLEYDDVGTMSDLELPSFQRGGFMRTSLPIVRSGSTSLERPLGLVFLVYGDQTKKSLLPNEITTLDTVRALFVRAFPDLTLDMLESPRKKIYLLDPATNIYFQLEDLAEIKDRSVLKIHETDSDEPQKVKERQEVRGRTVQMPRQQGRHGYAEVPVGPPEIYSTKAQSLPPQLPHGYPEMLHHDLERRSRSRTPEPTDRPRSLSAGAQGRQRYSHSPDRMPTPERGLNPIPENRQLTPGYREDVNGYYENIGAYRGHPYPGGHYEGGVPHPGYAPNQQAPPGTQAYVARSTRAPPLAHAQRAVAPSPDHREASGRNAHRHSLSFAPISAGQSQAPAEAGFQRSQSYRPSGPERDGRELVRSHSLASGDDGTKNRIEKMEAQLANLTAWVHYRKADTMRREVTPPPRSLASTTSESSDTFPASSASSLSDIPDGPHYPHHPRSSGESTPINGSAEVGMRVAQLKKDLHILRRQQQLNMEAMKEEFMNTFNKIKKVLSTVPGAENQLSLHRRSEATSVKKSYIDEKEQADKELGELEASVDELKNDVISRQCRVNMVDIEGVALLLSNITKILGDLKTRFPQIQSQMKEVMDGELRVVVSEEKFLKEQPNDIENSLKRCKNLSSTLYTLKRLASVQDHRPPQIPTMPTNGEETSKKTVLENIRALVPDHERRVQQMEAADAARERKKKISTQQEALKFGKSLEIASRNLKSANEKADEETDLPANQKKPAVPAKPSIILASSSSSSSASSSSSSVIASSSSGTSKTGPVSTVIAPSVTSSKPAFTASLASSTNKSMDKPTATVSAMTSASTSGANSNSVFTMASSEHGPSVVKAVSLPVTDTTGRLTSVHSGTGPVIHTVHVSTEAALKTNAPVAFQTATPSAPVKPPVFSKPSSLNISAGTKPGTSVSKPKSGSVSEDKSQTETQKPKKDSKTETSKSVTWSATTTEIKPASEGDRVSPENGSRETSPGSTDLAAQKQAARSAFFSSLTTPPTSPSMPTNNRNSAKLDEGPVLRPSPDLVKKVDSGPTINLVLSGTVSPKSPTSPGAFTISPPKEVVLAAAVAPSPPPSSTSSSSSTPSTSASNSPAHKSISASVSAPTAPPLAPPSQTNESSNEVTMRSRRVPPPPPPRRGSRPTSASVSPPVNGGSDSPSHQPSQESAPRFVGGPLAQHHHSGGPLSSTPKHPSQHDPFSKFESDIASGLYANVNRPELQSQRSCPQPHLSDTNRGLSSHNSKDLSKQRSSAPIARLKDDDEGSAIPPPPSVTMALDREERGSSSESTSSSSGTSMGSQQSVVSVVRSASVSGGQPQQPHQSSHTKAKPDPPRRHSSLLAKFTGSRESKHKIKNGNANVNGVDL